MCHSECRRVSVVPWHRSRGRWGKYLILWCFAKKDQGDCAIDRVTVTGKLRVRVQVCRTIAKAINGGYDFLEARVAHIAFIG